MERDNLPGKDPVETYHGLNDVQTAATLGRRALDARLRVQQGSYKDACPYIVLVDENGAEHVEFLKERMDPPKRKHGTVKLLDAKSFVAYWKLHGTDPDNGGVIYGSLRPAKFLAVLNDHGKTTQLVSGAGWRDHRADLTLAHAPEWTAWSQHDRQHFNSNEAFALFIEENAPDFVRPDASAMLNMALNFRVRQGVQFDLAQRLEDGNVELTYKNQVSANASTPAGGKLKIPEQFQINVRVFDGPESKQYKVDARFRYRLGDGQLKLWYELVRPARIVEAAFKDVWGQIEKETKATILYGSPE